MCQSPTNLRGMRQTALISSLPSKLCRALKRAIPSAMATAIHELRGLTRAQRVRYLRTLISDEQLRSLPNGLDGHSRVVFVCHGNIFRSPMAEALFAEELKRRDLPLHGVSSAGLFARDGREAHASGVEVARISGISLDAHRARLLTAKVVADSDLLVIMDRMNAAAILERFPEASERVVLLGAFDPEVERFGVAIPDPYGQSREEVVACYGRIGRAIRELANRIVEPR